MAGTIGRMEDNMERVKIGIVGCGNISSIYLENLSSKFRNTEVWAVCDMVEQRAQAAKEKIIFTIVELEGA